MRERKGEKPKVFREYTRVISEIRATRGRNAEHFIKIFRHESDNIAGASLGVLLGLFEIDDASEDSKYIVNFLFSVAKNEYFCNPRRGAMESFEAALHKINVALAEIVKHGNIGWLGKFHGNIAVLEKNSIHLSATGDGRIYLFRNGTLSHISEDLASPDAAEHPIKTFVEISSGRLAPNDRLLFILPKIFTLLDEDTLERQARRMDRERFTQFLKTAMVNELDQSGALIVDIEEPTDPPSIPPEPEKQKPAIKSYFSEITFENKREESVATALSEDSSHSEMSQPDYIDSKTGHIYIQGERTETPVEASRFAQYLEAFFHSSQQLREHSQATARRLFHRLFDRGKLLYFVSVERLKYAALACFKKYFRLPKRSTSSSIASVIPITVRNTSPVSEASSPSPVPPKNKNTSSTRFSPCIKQSFSQASNLLTHRAAPSLRVALRIVGTFFHTIIRRLFFQVQRLGKVGIPRIHSLFRTLQSSFFSLSPKRRFILFSFCCIIGGILTWIVFLQKSTAPSATENTPSVVTTSAPSVRDQERTTLDLPPSQTSFTYPDTVAATYLNDTLVIATRTTIEIPALNISAVLPVESGAIQSIAPMHDLRTLFILTDTGKLLAFTPTNRTFSENTLPSNPNSFSVLGAYLTYLYALSANGTSLLRFPRAGGGFSEGVSWLKETLHPDSSASLAVNDMVYIFSNHTLTQFSRGKAVRSFELPAIPPDHLLMATEPDNTLLVGLDTDNQRLIVWNTEGSLLNQHFGNQLSETKSIALHDHSVAISTNNNTFEITLPE